MDYIIDDWKNALKDFKSSVDKSLEEIRSCKAEVQNLRPEYVEGYRNVKYIRHPNRIVLSAPEIIIGNVDAEGNLLGDQPSKVIIRSNNIALDGVSSEFGLSGGSIVSRASSIRQIAVDPGIDGKEEVVLENSEFVAQARYVSLDSRADEGVFISSAARHPSTGVHVHADGGIILDATVSSVGKKKLVEESIKALQQHKSSMQQDVTAVGKSVDSLFSKLEKILKDTDSQEYTDEAVNGSIGLLNDLRIDLEDTTAKLGKCLDLYVAKLSALAETSRRIACLKEINDSIPSGSDFKKKSTGANVTITSETVNVRSLDGDGNIRDNEEAGVNVLATRVKVDSVDAENALQKEGSITLHARTLNLDASDTQYKDKTKCDEGENPAVGDVRIVSKNVSLQAVDYTFSKDKTEEKEFTKDGSLDIRVEKVTVSSFDKDGKATGKISLNAKDVELKSMDVKKDDGSDDKPAGGGTLVLTAEKVLAGSRDKDHKTKELQVVAEKTGVFGENTAELQQGDGKAVVQLDGGNLSLSGSKTAIFGDTTLNAKTDVKGDLTAPKASIGNLEAKSSFKSTNISDGIAVPGAPSTAKLSAKLKVQEKK